MARTGSRVMRAAVTLVMAVGLSVVVGGPVPASADLGDTPVNATIVIPRDAMDHGYATRRVTVSQDGVLSAVNLDSIDHTVTSDATDAGGTPLFSVRVPPGSTLSVPVAGLAAGTYWFHCTFHPSMRGQLIVTGSRGGTTGTLPSFDQALVVPRQVAGRHVRLVQRRAGVRVMPAGPLTRMWTYGGTYPGPTIRRPTGHETDVTVVNRLPRSAGSTSMHLHGDHHASRYDGQPTHFLVRHGRTRTYRYPLTDDGRAEPGSFFWYHDHRMDRTSRNNWNGLQGMMIVDDPAEKRLRLPHGRRDVPLMISERSLDAHNQLIHPSMPTMVMDHGAMSWTGPHAPPNDGIPGERILVNGRYAPHLDVSATRYRLRLLNSSGFSMYDLALSNGRPLVQIGTGDGLLRHPVVRPDILLGPSQRAQVIVDFHGLEGQNVVLTSIPRADATSGTGSRPGAAMEFRVRHAAPDRSRIPAQLPSPALAPAPRHVTHTWHLGLAHGPHGRSYWSIDGKAFDPHRADVTVPLGSVRRWRIVNDTRLTHFVHLHEEQWRTLLRDGRRPPPWERGLEDTWRLDPGESIEVAARFSDYTGLFMLHCHMLDHEDHGMMAQFDVVRR